jgi:hypothetical protein
MGYSDAPLRDLQVTNKMRQSPKIATHVRTALFLTFASPKEKSLNHLILDCRHILSRPSLKSNQLPFGRVFSPFLSGNVSTITKSDSFRVYSLMSSFVFVHTRSKYTRYKLLSYFKVRQRRLLHHLFLLLLLQSLELVPKVLKHRVQAPLDPIPMRRQPEVYPSIRSIHQVE